MVKTVLKQEGLNCKKRKFHVNLESITFQGRLKSIPEIIQTSTFIVKKAKTASKFQIPQWAGKFERWG